MKSSPFVKLVNPKVKKRLVMCISGKEKTGKTHFALGAPGPIAFFNLDTGCEGVVDKFVPPAGDKEIHIVEVGMPDTEGGAKEQVKLFNKAFDIAIEKSSPFRTIIIDTATALWEILRLSEWGALSKNPQHYAALNPKFVRVIREAMSGDKNLILLQRLKEEWGTDKAGRPSPTGNFIPAGHKGTPYEVQLVCEMFREDPADGTDFNLRIVECRHDPSASGEVISGEMCVFSFLGLRVMSSSDYSDWI